MTSLCLRFTLATLVGASILFCAPQTTHAFNGHLFGRGPTVAYYVPQPAVPAVVAPTVAYSPVVTVPAKPVTAYCAPVPMSPVPAGVTAYTLQHRYRRPLRHATHQPMLYFTPPGPRDEKCHLFTVIENRERYE